MLSIRAFRAVDEPQTCRVFLSGHIQVLEDYGIANISTNEPTWMGHSSVYCIVAELANGGDMIGGARVHVADGIHPLPFEEAVGKLDKKVYDLVKQTDIHKTGEICALWNATRLNGKGYGLAYILTRAGIAMVEQLQLESLYTICAEYSLKMVRSMVFQVEESLGREGTFVYPSEKYLTRLLRRLDVVNLKHTQEEHKKRIISLRENPNQKADEQGKYGMVAVHYHLQLKKVDSSLQKMTTFAPQ